MTPGWYRPLPGSPYTRPVRIDRVGRFYRGPLHSFYACDGATLERTPFGWCAWVFFYGAPHWPEMWEPMAVAP